MHAQPGQLEEGRGKPLRRPSGGPTLSEPPHAPLHPTSNLKYCLHFQMEFFKVKINAR